MGSAFAIRLAIGLVISTVAGAGAYQYNHEQQTKINSANEAARITAVATTVTPPQLSSKVPISAAGSKNTFDLRTGDCFTMKALSSSAVEAPESVSLSPCVKGAYSVMNLFLLTGSKYPGDAVIEREAGARCSYGFTDILFPTSRSWDAGDRTVTCLKEITTR